MRGQAKCRAARVGALAQPCPRRLVLQQPREGAGEARRVFGLDEGDVAAVAQRLDPLRRAREHRGDAERQRGGEGASSQAVPPVRQDAQVHRGEQLGGLGGAEPGRPDDCVGEAEPVRLREVDLVAGAVGGADHREARGGAVAPEPRERLEEVLHAPGEVELAEVAEEWRVTQPQLAADGVRRAPRFGGDVRAHGEPAHRLRPAGNALDRPQVVRIVARQDGAPAEERERLELDRQRRAPAEPEVPECRHQGQPTQSEGRGKLVASLQNGVRKEDVDDVDTLAPQQLVRLPKRPPSVLRERPVLDRPVNRHPFAHLLALRAAAGRGEHVHLRLALGERGGEAGDEVGAAVPLRGIGAEDNGDAHGC